MWKLAQMDIMTLLLRQIRNDNTYHFEKLNTLDADEILAGEFWLT